MATRALGRVAVFGGESAARAVRAIHELARSGIPAVAVAVHGPRERQAQFVREADFAVEFEGSIEDGLRAAQADHAWPGRADRDLPVNGVDPGARLIEIVVARDHSGAARVVGSADVTLRRLGRAVLAESPAAGDEAGALAACSRPGVWAVLQAIGPGGTRILGLRALADSAPAIEATTGLDLIRLALSIAAGLPVGDLAPQHGHAFAARILARDPESHPGQATGPVEVLRLPSGAGLRSEAALREGEEPLGMDGALATIVAHGATRVEALHRLEQALADAEILLRCSGTSKAWLRALCARPEVAGGEVTAGLLDRLPRLVQPRREAALLIAAIDAYHFEEDLERARFVAEARRGRPRVGPSSGRTVELRYLGRRYRLEVRQLGPRRYLVTSPGGGAAGVELDRSSAFERQLIWQGRRHRAHCGVDGLRLLVQVDDVAHLILRDPAGVVTSPMPAVVAAIHVERGQAIAAGEPLVRIESMKVEVEVTAPAAGTVREILVAANGQVDAGEPLLRLEPLGGESEASGAPEPLELGGAPRDLSVVSTLRQLLLGFDVPVAEAGNLAAAARALPSDPAAVGEEDWALGAFGDLQLLFSRVRPAGGGPPALEELWRYLHEPEARGAGLSADFVATLRRALSRYGVSLDSPGRDLELALLRIQKSHERAEEQLGPVLSILERRLAGPPPAREVLDRLAQIGQERFPALADLAREIRYRAFDQPAMDRVRRDACARVDSDLAQLGAASPAEREAILARLVECSQPLTTLLVDRIAHGHPLQGRLVEAILRRYYRFRRLESARAIDGDGAPAAFADYELRGQKYRLIACAARAADATLAARRLAGLVAEAPADREAIVELYLWREREEGSADDLARDLRAALEATRFPRPLRRASVVVCTLGGNQQHFTFRSSPPGWAEEARYRGVHPMLFERLNLGRLAKFDLQRLPSVADVYLYRGVAQGNPKDERLFAMAEVRDLTPVRDAGGRIAQLPALERILHEALAGMRVFQARRAPNQRLEWNRVLLTLAPPLEISRDDVARLAARLAPATEGLGIEMVLLTARVPDPATGVLRETLLRMATTGSGLSIRWDEPTDRPLEPMAEYQQKVVQLRRRGLTHPFELVRMLTPEPGAQSGMPPGDFVEHDLDASGALVPVRRPPGSNTANVVTGVIRNFTPRYPEGMTRVAIFGDPGREMGSVAEPECRRIEAAIALATKLRAPLEWFEVCAGAKISMTTGTENMDWVSRVLRRLIEFTQAGGEVNVVVLGITVGAQPYWNAEATMLMHTRGILVMAPGATMVLTGKQALEYSGSVSAEDNEGIGGYDRIMGPNGQAQYQAGSVAEALQILMRHYDHAFVAPGERFPRTAPTGDPPDRDVRAHPHGPEGGAGFTTVGDIFSPERNPERKKPFEIRAVMGAAVDQDHAPLERWKDLRGGETAIVWDAHVGGFPVCLIGIQSRPTPRLEFVPADGPEMWSAGTLFPQSSKKIARALNSASGNRPAVILANLSGFDGSPESMRRLQLEYGAEIGRAVVNFKGPIVFCVVSRYHGGAFVVFAKTLTENIEIAAIEGARASVIGGAPAAAVVFARDVESRTRKDPRVGAAEKDGPARLAEVVAAVRSEKLGEVGDEYDRVHSVERALEVGSLDRIIAAKDLRPYLIDAVSRGIGKFTAR